MFSSSAFLLASEAVVVLVVASRLVEHGAEWNMSALWAPSGLVQFRLYFIKTSSVGESLIYE